MKMRVRNSRRLPLVVLAVAGAMVVAACSSSSPSSSSPSSSSKTGSADAPLKVGIVLFSSDNPVTVGVSKQIQAVGAPLGWEFSEIDPGASVEKAVGAMNTLIQQRVSVIVTMVFESNGLAAGLQRAKAAGIPVVTYGGGPADGIQASWDIGTGSGADIAARILKDTKGEATILALGYTPGLPCRAREEALNAAVKGKPSITLKRQEVPVPGAAAATTQFTNAYLTTLSPSAPDPVVWACYDGAGVPAAAAVKASKRSGVKVYSFDGTAAALQQIKAGTMTASVWLDPVAGGNDVAKKLPGVVAAGTDGTPENFDAPGIIVDSSNLTEFLADHPDALTGS